MQEQREIVGLLSYPFSAIWTPCVVLDLNERCNHNRCGHPGFISSRRSTPLSKDCTTVPMCARHGRSKSAQTCGQQVHLFVHLHIYTSPPHPPLATREATIRQILLVSHDRKPPHLFRHPWTLVNILTVSRQRITVGIPFSFTSLFPWWILAWQR